jgi:hypothetical protein
MNHWETLTPEGQRIALIWLKSPIIRAQWVYRYDYLPAGVATESKEKKRKRNISI